MPCFLPRHLNGSKLESLVGRPAVLITGSSCALTLAPSQEARDKALMERVLGAVRSGGRVLLPVDTAGRVLELLLLLEATWQEERWGGTSAEAVAICSRVRCSRVQ
jgi:cleavage and polyadenylation specificity factor subunit 2